MHSRQKETCLRKNPTLALFRSRGPIRKTVLPSSKIRPKELTCSLSLILRARVWGRHDAPESPPLSARNCLFQAFDRSSLNSADRISFRNPLSRPGPNAYVCAFPLFRIARECRRPLARRFPLPYLNSLCRRIKTWTWITM